MNEVAEIGVERLRMWSVERASMLSHHGSNVSEVIKAASAIEDYVLNGEDSIGEVKSKVEFALKAAFDEHVHQVADSKRDRVLGVILKSLKDLGVVGDL